MYSCSDILTTDTVFDEEDEPFEGDEYFDEYVPGNVDEDQSSTSSQRSLPDLSPAESSPLSSSLKTGHGTQSLGSPADPNQRLPFPGSSNGLGFVCSSSSASKEDNGIPIANSRRMANVAPNGAFMATSPSPSSPPVFFSLPSHSQFSQVHQQFFDQPQNHHHLLRVFSSPPQNNFANDSQYLGSPSPPSDYDTSQMASFGRGRETDIHHPPYHQHLYEEDHYQEGSPYMEGPEIDPRHLHIHSDTNFHRTDDARRSHPHLSYEGSYSIPSSYRHHHMHPSTPHFEEYYSSNSSHSPSNGNDTISAPSSPSASSTSPAHSTLSKKERNRLAAERCRKKKQDLISSLSRENKLLHQGNIELMRANHYLEQKLDYLINILISMDPAQVVLLKDIHKQAPAFSGFYVDSSLSPKSASTSIGASNSPTPKYPNFWGPYSGNNDQMSNRAGAMSASPLMVPIRSSPNLKYLPHDSVGYEYKIDPKQSMGSSVSPPPAPPQSK